MPPAYYSWAIRGFAILEVTFGYRSFKVTFIFLYIILYIINYICSICILVYVCVC